MRVVLDTNVLISAIFFSGPPSRILAAWIDERFELAASTQILDEYRKVADRIGERFPGVEVRPVLDRICFARASRRTREAPKRCMHGSG